jgi:hypothetical protein
MHESAAFANAAGVRKERIVKFGELNGAVKGFGETLRHVLLGERPVARQKTETDGSERQNYDARTSKPAGKAPAFPGPLLSVGSF